MMKIVCISDTHGYHEQIELPEGDLLLCAGDISRRGRPKEIRRFNDWLGTLSFPRERIILIAGNHDFLFEQEPSSAQAMMTNCIYLQDEEIEVLGLRIYGSPWQPWFHNWAFNLQRGSEIREKWEMIPDGIDILMTHGPPFGHSDVTFNGEAVGCEDLLEAVLRIRPTLHLFGHIHEAHGVTSNRDTTFVNASICTLGYDAIQPPIVFSWQDLLNVPQV